MHFEITDLIDDKDRNEVLKGLREYNLSKLEDKNPKELGIYYRVDGIIKAGLIGETHGNWLEIDYLWVEKGLRKTGIGSKLLREAESEAKRRGCKYCFLNTFGFQAPIFYMKYEYKEVFTLENFPLEGTRHYYVKNLV